MSIERECNVCGNRFFASKNTHCPTALCTGMMHRIVTPVPGKRVSGVLCRNPETNNAYDIMFVINASLSDVFRNSNRGNIWDHIYDEFNSREWTKEEWQKQYGKLPRKGSKDIVILELSNV